ncbi:hypothetical protein EPI10_027841 [Gossypium australe]|uniref:Uncharacterized protein n=1 Tax=Gossypium australe TaxID=47621 RepID=A0A5B6UWA8_9ROSI|nr:hypothetical protein EPI10_027841 [Gossypium australe]
MQTKLKGEIRLELESILDQYTGQSSPIFTPSLPQDKGKGILGGQPSSFPPKEAFMVSPLLEIGYCDTLKWIAPTLMESTSGASGQSLNNFLRLKQSLTMSRFEW